MKKLIFVLIAFSLFANVVTVYADRTAYSSSSIDPLSGERQSVIPVSNAVDLNGLAVGNIGWGLIGTDLIETGSTTMVLNLTAHVARVGDIIWVNSGSAIRSWASICAAATNTVTLCNALPATPANGDQVYIQRPHPIAASNNTNNTAQSLAVFADANFQNTAATGLLKLEDAPTASGDAGVMALLVQESAINAQASAAAGDYAPLKGDTGGRLVTTMAPRGETVIGCNTAITTATTGVIIPAVASKVTAVTSWDCTNTGGTATRVILEDGDGTDLGNAFLPATSGYFNQAFVGIPAYTQATNKAIQVNVITTGASVICCARGFSTSV